jgi:hypothetical protein
LKSENKWKKKTFEHEVGFSRFGTMAKQLLMLKWFGECKRKKNEKQKNLRMRLGLKRPWLSNY